MPFCFARQFDFRERYGWGAGSLGVGEAEIYPAIVEERDCDAFTPWQQGFSPREHREMLDRDRMIQRDDEMRKAIWEREDQRDTKVEERHKEEMDTLRAQHRWQLAIFGGAVIVATLIGAMIEAGWIGSP